MTKDGKKFFEQKNGNYMTKPTSMTAVKDVKSAEGLSKYTAMTPGQVTAEIEGCFYLTKVGLILR